MEHELFHKILKECETAHLDVVTEFLLNYRISIINKDKKYIILFHAIMEICYNNDKRKLGKLLRSYRKCINLNHNIGTYIEDHCNSSLIETQDLPNKIKELRIMRGLTQEELGIELGVQKSQVSRIERGCNETRMGTILRVFRILEAEIKFFINEK